MGGWPRGVLMAPALRCGLVDGLTFGAASGSNFSFSLSIVLYNLKSTPVFNPLSVSSFSPMAVAIVIGAAAKDRRASGRRPLSPPVVPPAAAALRRRLQLKAEPRSW